jgi:hypothetical protein
MSTTAFSPTAGPVTIEGAIGVTSRSASGSRTGGRTLGWL